MGPGKFRDLILKSAMRMAEQPAEEEPGEEAKLEEEQESNPTTVHADEPDEPDKEPEKKSSKLRQIVLPFRPAPRKAPASASAESGQPTPEGSAAEASLPHHHEATAEGCEAEASADEPEPKPCQEMQEMQEANGDDSVEPSLISDSASTISDHSILEPEEAPDAPAVAVVDEHSQSAPDA